MVTEVWSQIPPLREPAFVPDVNVPCPISPEGGALPNKRDNNARQKIRIKTLKETNLGVVQALFDPKRRPC